MKKLSLVVSSLAMSVCAFAAATKVDILVAYDTSAAAWLEADGRTQADFAAAQVAKANTVLANSRVDDAFEFRLAGVYEGRFTHDKASDLGVTLGLAVEGTAGEWTELRAARDAAGADIVVVLVDTGRTSGELGASNSMLPKVSTNGGEEIRYWGLDFPAVNEYLAYFAERAYSVCDIATVDTDNVFVHEVGHVMGAGHSEIIAPAYDDPGPQLFQYSSALMYEGSDGEHYATVMGYDKTGYAGSPKYVVLPYFSSSSPEVVNPVTGEPLGDADHDNVKTLRETCVKVAAFRAAVDDGGQGGGDDGQGGEGGEGGGQDTPSRARGEFAEKKTIVPCAVYQDGEVVGTVTFTVAKTKNGLSKVSAVVFGLDGKKAKAKAAKCEVFLGESGVATVVYDSEVKGYGGRLHAVISADGLVSADSAIGNMALDVAAVDGLQEGVQHGFYLVDDLSAVGGAPVLQAVVSGDTLYSLIPYAANPEPVLVSGVKWAAAAKAGKVKSKKNSAGEMDIIVDTGNDGSKTNLSALKISYAAKTGTFKGSFTAYTVEGGKVKKYKFKVGGVVVDGIGYGTAVNTKTGTVVQVQVR